MLNAVIADDLEPQIKVYIVYIILWLKNTVKLPVGASNTVEREDMYWNVYRDRRNVFSFSFHAR